MHRIYPQEPPILETHHISTSQGLQRVQEPHLCRLGDKRQCMGPTGTHALIFMSTKWPETFIVLPTTVCHPSWRHPLIGQDKNQCNDW